MGEDTEYVLNILPVALPKGRMSLIFCVLLLEIALPSVKLMPLIYFFPWLSCVKISLILDDILCY